MACNCGKNKKAQPAGMGVSREIQKAQQAARDARKQTPPAGLKKLSSFTLITRDGKAQTFGSRLEADAARVRAGGGTVRAAR